MTNRDAIPWLAWEIFVVIMSSFIVLLVLIAVAPRLMDGPFSGLGPLLARVAIPGIGFLALIVLFVLALAYDSGGSRF